MCTIDGTTSYDANEIYEEIFRGHMQKLDNQLTETDENGNKKQDFIIYFNDEERAVIDKFVEAVVEAKLEEGGEYNTDGRSLDKRFRTGITGEMAVMKMLGVDLSNLDVNVGNTQAFKYHDLACIGINAGVKTVSGKRAPMVYENHKDTEFFCMIDEEHGDDRVIFLGIGSPAKINGKASKFFLNDKRAYDNKPEGRRKICFWGLSRLDLATKIEDIAELPYIRVNWDKFNAAKAC